MKQHRLKISITALLLFFISIAIYAQTPSQQSIYDVPTKPDVMPEYPGGINAMVKFISQNLKYPEKARNAKLDGVVYVSFTVDSLGTITKTNVKKTKYTIHKIDEKTKKETLASVDNPKDKSLEVEAIRVIKAMPRWKPGMSLGRPINVEYTLPVKFDLNKSK
jgi:periplasmic protein TonB